YDPKEHAYKMRDQVFGLIQLYQGKGGADAVNQAISDQKLEYLVNTVRMESDMAHGISIAATGGALSSTQAGYAPEQGGKVAAPEKGGKSEAAPEPETGLAPEPETVKMTPAEQGITPGTSETPTVRPVDEIGLPNAVGSVEEVGIEAHHIEKVFKG